MIYEQPSTRIRYGGHSSHDAHIPKASNQTVAAGLRSTDPSPQSAHKSIAEDASDISIQVSGPKPTDEERSRNKAAAEPSAKHDAIQMSQKCVGIIAQYKIRYGNEGESFLQHLTPRMTKAISAQHYSSQPTVTLRELTPRLGIELIKPFGLFPLSCALATRKMARWSWMSRRGFLTSSMFLAAISGQVSKKAQVEPLFKQSSMPWNPGSKLHGSSWSSTSLTG